MINGGRPHLLVGWTCPLPDQPGHDLRLDY
jgi:hypothetical protein